MSTFLALRVRGAKVKKTNVSYKFNTASSEVSIFFGKKDSKFPHPFLISVMNSAYLTVTKHFIMCTLGNS